MFEDTTVNLNIKDDLFKTKGLYLIKIDIIEEGIGWFSQEKKELPSVLVIVE